MVRGEPTYKFTVRSKYPFPMDMLRYDRCYPATAQTAHDMATSMTHGHDEPVEYEMIGAQGFGGPTSARWESFMFKVTSVETIR
jgi:hypothetical protein